MSSSFVFLLLSIYSIASGFGMALVLRREHIISSWINLFGITIAWLISSIGALVIIWVLMPVMVAISLPSSVVVEALFDGIAITLFFMLWGTIGGLGTALILRKESALSGLASIFVVCFGWGIGFTISGIVISLLGYVLKLTVESIPTTTLMLITIVVVAIAITIGVAIGAFGMVFELRDSYNKIYYLKNPMR